MLAMPVPLRYGFSNCRAATDKVMHRSDTITMHGLAIAVLPILIAVGVITTLILTATLKSLAICRSIKWQKRFWSWNCMLNINMALRLGTLNYMNGTP